MTVKLSEYDEALLREIGHFCDTILAEQVRAVMIARNNAEEKVKAVKAELADAQSRIDKALADHGHSDPKTLWCRSVILHKGSCNCWRAALSVAPGGVA